MWIMFHYDKHFKNIYVFYVAYVVKSRCDFQNENPLFQNETNIPFWHSHYF